MSGPVAFSSRTSTRLTVLTLALSLVLAATPFVAKAHAFFGPPAPLNSAASIDAVGVSQDVDRGQKIAADGQGNWVVVWDSLYDAGGSGVRDWDVLVARSLDNGETWSQAAELDPTVSAENSDVWHLATDRQGVWVTTVTTWTDVSPPVAGISRSVDNGATWSSPVLMGLQGASPAVVTATGNGTWLAVWDTSNTLGDTVGPDMDLVFAISADGGASWTPETPLNSDAGVDGFNDESPVVGTDGNGTILVIWNRQGFLTTARSLDNGATWSPPTVVSSSAISSLGIAHGVATNGEGTWIATWESSDPSGATDTDLFYARSSDNGASWTPQALVNPKPGVVDRSFDLRPRIWIGGDGSWYIAWASEPEHFVQNPGALGSDRDIVLARSRDDGQSWSSLAALQTNAANDEPHSDFDVEVVHDGVGTAVAVWYSRNPFVGVPIGDDHDILFSTSTDDCPQEPVGGCLTTTSPRKSKLTIKAGDVGKHKLAWKWARGQETTLADLGDPTVSTGYVLCGYDSLATVFRALFEKDIAAGTTCRGAPCWDATSKGFRYRDRSSDQGAVSTVKFRPGTDGKAKMKVTAKGPLVGPPALPLSQAPDVVVQLHNVENGRCWEAAFSTSNRNDAQQFKAKSD